MPKLFDTVINVLFLKRSSKEFHAAGPAQEKARLPYVDSRHLGTIPYTLSIANRY